MNKKRELTIVGGCGQLGANIAGRLSDTKKDVLVIDYDKSAFRKLPYSYGGLTLTGSITDLEKLKITEINKAKVFIAVTDKDSVNICAAQIAKQIFKIPKVLARIYDQEKVSLVKDMGIDYICPTELSEGRISEYINIGGKLDV